MFEGSLGLIIEGLVSVLLVATIFYCISVNRKLERLRDEQKGMRSFITELSTATTNADKAIKGLRSTVQHSGTELAEQIKKGRNMTRQLKGEIEVAQQTMNKLVILTGNSSEPQRSKTLHSDRFTAPLPRSDLRSSMLGFEDLDFDEAANTGPLSDGQFSNVKGEGK